MSKQLLDDKTIETLFDIAGYKVIGWVPSGNGVVMVLEDGSGLALTSRRGCLQARRQVHEQTRLQVTLKARNILRAMLTDEISTHRN